MSTRRPAPNFIPSLPPRERAPLRPARPRLPAGPSARQRLMAAVRTRERKVWIVAGVSLLLHLLVIALLIWGPQGRDEGEAPGEAGVAMVFEEPPAVPAPVAPAPSTAAQAGHASAPPLPAPAAPPGAVAAGPPPPPPVPYSPPVEAPGPPPPAPVEQAPPQTPPETPSQVQPTPPDLAEATPAPEMPPVPTPLLPQEAPALVTPSSPSDEALPLPLPPRAPSPPSPAPTLSRPPAPAQSPLAHPRAWTLAPQARPGVAGAPRLPRGALDLAYGETGHGPAIDTDETFDVVAPGASQGFMAALQRYAREHHSYPARAAPLCESGDVTAAITINRDGTVDSVSVERYSQFADLNSAWVHFWGLAAKLPSFTPDMTMSQIVVHYTARYKALGCGAR